jgi:hypothetical protein
MRYSTLNSEDQAIYTSICTKNVNSMHNVVDLAVNMRKALEDPFTNTDSIYPCARIYMIARSIIVDHNLHSTEA